RTRGDAPRPGRDLRRAADLADGRCQPPRRCRRGPRLARRRPPARVLSGLQRHQVFRRRERGGGRFVSDNWLTDDPFADPEDPAARERAERRAAREEKRREKAEKEGEAPPPEPTPPPAAPEPPAPKRTPEQEFWGEEATPVEPPAPAPEPPSAASRSESSTPAPEPTAAELPTPAPESPPPTPEPEPPQLPQP